MTRDGIVTCDQFLHHAPDQVWRALTEPDLLKRWWVAGDIRPVVGHRFTLDMGKYGQQSCEVVAVDPGSMISYTFGVGTLDSRITWRLVPEGTGTRLFLEHTGFDLDSPLGRLAYEGMGSGWPHVLPRVDRALDSLRAS